MRIRCARMQSASGNRRKNRSHVFHANGCYKLSESGPPVYRERDTAKGILRAPLRLRADCTFTLEVLEKKKTSANGLSHHAVETRVIMKNLIPLVAISGESGSSAVYMRKGKIERLHQAILMKNILT